eukprot:509423-Rhodomonas_salina.1
MARERARVLGMGTADAADTDAPSAGSVHVNNEGVGRLSGEDQRHSEGGAPSAGSVEGVGLRSGE